MYGVAARLTPESYHQLARATFGEMALAGITSVGEFHYVHHQPDGRNYTDPNEMGKAMLAAAAEVGIRITLLDTMYLHGGLDAGGYQEPTGSQLRYADRTADCWAERVDGLADNDTQRIGAAIHSVRAVDPGSMTTAAQWAATRNAPLHAHIYEQQQENEQCLAAHGATPTAVLHAAGVLGERFCAVHATHLTSADLDLLASTSARVCLCPTTERDLGDGIGPARELRDRGVSLSLGSDSHAVIDHFEEARAVELNDRLRFEQRGLHSAPELLRMASCEGHRVLGWHDAGTVRVGALADFISVDVGSVRTAGASRKTLVEAAVFAATAADLHSVVVGGEQIVRDGIHRSIDVAAELHSTITKLVTP